MTGLFARKNMNSIMDLDVGNEHKGHRVSPRAPSCIGPQSCAHLCSYSVFPFLSFEINFFFFNNSGVAFQINFRTSHQQYWEVLPQSSKY